MLAPPNSNNIVGDDDKENSNDFDEVVSKIMDLIYQFNLQQKQEGDFRILAEATYGRKEKAVEKRSQMVIDEDKDEELTWHPLPTRATRSQTKTKKPHKLSEAIENNVSAARKHEKTMF